MTTIQKYCLGAVSAVVGLVSAATFGSPATAKPETVIEWVEIEAMQEQSSRLYFENKYADAIKLARRSLAAAEQLFGPDHPVVAASLTIIADSYQAQGRSVDAEPLQRRSLIIRQATQASARLPALRDGTPANAISEVGQSLNNLALIYRSEKRYREAEAILTMTLDVYERANGTTNATTALTLQNLALVHIFQERFADAERLMQKYPTVRAALEQIGLIVESGHAQTADRGPGKFASPITTKK
jgi:tetratricopeptide (TPR) repeat protein